MKVKHWLIAVVLIIAVATVLQGCGGSSSSSGSGVMNMTWSTWGNPGELKRFQTLTDAYNKAHTNVHWKLVPIPNDGYAQKLQTELAGGTAADVFYMGDGDMSTFVKDNVLLNMTPFMGSGPDPHQISDWPEGVYGAAKKANEVYGLPPDCNPILLYFNKTVLKDAGVTEDPIKLYESGKWNWDAFVRITEKVKASGKYGYIQDNWWGPTYSWVYADGGQMYNEGGDFVGNTNAKAVESFQFLENNIKNGNFTYSGSLPKGQGDDAMFMSNQVAFVSAGRWYAPEFNANKDLNYDVVPYPSNTGTQLNPSGIALAYVGINKKTAHKQEAWDFLDYFVSNPGVKERLSNGGNAVPALADGPDEVVTQGKPAHSSYFLKLRQIGKAVPTGETALPGFSTTVANDLDLAFLGKQPIQTALDKVSSDFKKAKAESKS